MTFRSCRLERDVQRAVLTRRWTTDLVAHADACERCREVRLVGEALQAPLPPSPVAADPRVLWAAARHARRLRGEAQIALILTASQIAACVIVITAVIRFARWPDAWPALSFDVDERTLWYGALALVTAAMLGLSRLITNDRDRGHV